VDFLFDDFNSYSLQRSNSTIPLVW